jgi:hypothetical protein
VASGPPVHSGGFFVAFCSARYADAAPQADAFGAGPKIWRSSAAPAFFQDPEGCYSLPKLPVSVAPGFKGLNARDPLKVHHDNGSWASGSLTRDQRLAPGAVTRIDRHTTARKPNAHQRGFLESWRGHRTFVALQLTRFPHLRAGRVLPSRQRRCTLRRWIRAEARTHPAGSHLPR